MKNQYLSSFIALLIAWVTLSVSHSASGAPSTPTNPSPGTASSPGPIQASSTVTMSWSASPGATYYDIGVRDIATGALVVDTTTANASYTATLTAGKAYRWNVAAGNATGLSSYTTVRYFQTPTVVVIPATPTNPVPGTASSPGPIQASSTVTMSWSASPGATYYDIGVRDIATGALVVDTTTANASYTTALTAGKTYRWNVAAGNATGLSSYTAVRYFQTPGTKPLKPTNPSPGNITTVTAPSSLTWSNGGGATSYRVYFGTDATPDSGEEQGTQAGASFAPTGLNAGTTYYWKIDAINTAGETTGDVWSFTVEQILTAPTVRTDSATNVSATGATLNATVTNTGGGAITDARFEYTSSSFPGTVIDTVPVNGTSFSHALTGLSPGTTYTVHAFAKNSVGWSAASNNLSFATGVPPATDYPGATWAAAAVGNYETGNRSSSTVPWIIIHTTDGSAAATISWFQNPVSKASAHYMVARTGAVTQFVREGDVAYTAGNYSYNLASINIEIEQSGVETPTSIQYSVAADLVKSIQQRFSVPTTFPTGIMLASPASGSGIIGHNQVPDPTNAGLGGGLHHHTDPVNWDWAVFRGYFNTPQPGSLRVTLTPADAVNAGAQWQVDGGPFQSSGATVNGLSAGNHTVAFKAITGWTTPGNQAIAVVANQTAAATGPYILIQVKGSAMRTLPSFGYAPGAALSVAIAANPAASVSSYAVEDAPPASWTVSNISQGGTLDTVNGKVKWGPFFDNAARTLTYQVTPPIGETGAKTFAGSASFDGQSAPIDGGSSLDKSNLQFHPTDTNNDLQIVINELTAYGSAWKTGSSWPVSPNPIDVNYVTRAGYLWKNGELYHYDSSQTAPLSWQTGSAAAAQSARSQVTLAPASTASAIRGLPSSYAAGSPVNIAITASPAAGTSAYAIEDAPPIGWTVSNIDNGGVWDAVNGKVKWGPFFDNTSRTLNYRATPPVGTAGVRSFNGTASFDGVGAMIGGTGNITNASPQRYTLNLNPTTGGSIGVNPQPGTDGKYADGTVVTVTAIPSNSGIKFIFSSWSGDASGMQNPLSVTMNANKAITASFIHVDEWYTLNINAINGTVAKSPNLTNYKSGTVVALTATPADGYQFTGWGGDASGAQNPLQVTMNTSKNITAVFNSERRSVIEFGSSTYRVVEGTPDVTIPVIRTVGTEATSVTLRLTPGTASADDFAVDEITVAFAEGQTQRDVLVPITDDSEVENDETFVATLLNPTNGATLGAVNPATITITETVKLDGAIGMSAARLVGWGVINNDAAGQEIVINVARGTKRTAIYAPKNMGAQPTSLLVRGTARVAGKFSVRYLRGREDITAQVIEGKYRFDGLGSEEYLPIKVEVGVNSSVPHRRIHRIMLTVSSPEDSSVSDTCALRVRAWQNDTSGQKQQPLSRLRERGLLLIVAVQAKQDSNDCVVFIGKLKPVAGAMLRALTTRVSGRTRKTRLPSRYAPGITRPMFRERFARFD